MGNACAGVLNPDDQAININFDYNVDNKDNSDSHKPKRRTGGYEDNDRFDHENTLFSQGKVYKADPELEIGFPENKQEYDSFPCLEDVIEEYEAVPRGRPLSSNVPFGLREIYQGARDFFDAEKVDY